MDEDIEHSETTAKPGCDRPLREESRMSDPTNDAMKVYHPPKIIYSERIEARAVTCAMDSSTTGGCEDGPIQS